MLIQTYIYKGATIKLFLSGNWWNFSINDDPCLESFSHVYLAKQAAEELIDLAQGNKGD